jgi:hypothetical protein
MIGWLVDRVWAHKNRVALAEIDAQQAHLCAEGERLERRMVEEFGPDWRQKAEQRLQERLSCRWTME